MSSEEIVKEELDEELDSEDEVIDVNEKWKFRIIETEEGKYYHQCMLCGNTPDELSDKTRNVKLGAMGHARSHDINKQVTSEAESKDKILDTDGGLDESEDDIMPDESNEMPMGEPESSQRAHSMEQSESEVFGEEVEWQPYEEPMSATETLKQIFEDYKSRFKKGFMKMMLRRSKRRDGIHPTELVDYIIDMKSGVSGNKEARLIAEEYRDLLMKQKRLAEERGVEVHLPLGSKVNPTSGKRKPRHDGLRMDSPSTTSQTSAHEPRRSKGSNAVPSSPGNSVDASEDMTGMDNESGTDKDLIKMFMQSKDKEIDRLQQMKEERDQLEREMEKEKQRSEVDRLENKVDTMMQQFNNTLNELKDALKDGGGNDDSLTAEEVEMMLEKEREQSRADRLEEKLESMNDKIDNFEDRLEKEREEKRELREKLMSEKSKSHASPGDWQNDEYRMLSAMGQQALDLGDNWVKESKKTRRMLIKSLLEEGEISKQEAEEMLKKNEEESGEKILEEYADEEDIER